jgi:enoyl-CoA hydratase/carnithine racemase
MVAPMLRTDVKPPIAWLALDRADKLNAMTRGFFGELVQAVQRAEQDDSVRAVVIHGEGACFSVGGDIVAFGELDGAADRREYVREAMWALRAVEECSKPTIAAVHGHALGGGCELTLVCDLVVADETARFALPETSVGLVPGPGLVRARVHTGLHALKYMILTGSALDAHEARAAGLVNEVVPAGGHLARAEEWAGLIAKRAPVALAAAKAFLAAGGWDRYAHAVDTVALLQGSDDVAEGIAAFREKRPARFSGR